MAEFRCESIEKYGDCAVDREQWRGEERPIQCSFCCYYKPIMTNAEKIRAMTDEELATFLDKHLTVVSEYDGNKKHAVRLLEWLKQEVKNE